MNLERGIKISARRDAARAVHADITVTDPSQVQGLPPGAIITPIGTVEVPLTTGTVLHVRECQDSTESEQKRDVFNQLAEQEKDCRYFSDPFKKLGGNLDFVPLGNADQIALERDYWAAYSKANRQNLFSNATGSLLLGLLWGFPGGIGIWIFYRLVRFAIKG